MRLAFWRKNRETRSTGSGFTAEIMAARESWISGVRGLAELTSAAQTCVSLWEHGLSQADVNGSDLLDPVTLALCARALALRGEALFLIDDQGLVPCSDWEVSTRNGRPRAYRVSISEAGGGRTETALAGEVVHVRIGADVAAPWSGVAPLKRASLSAGLLNAVETVLSEVFETAPIGSTVMPFPESADVDVARLQAGFRGRRGQVLLRESVNVTAAGGPAPQADWKPADLTPDIERAMVGQIHGTSRDQICSVFGVLPALLNPAATGPIVREAQRHLAQYQLQPLANLLATEATEKTGAVVTLDVMRPLQAFDTGGRARAITSIIGALAQAKEAGIDPKQAMELVDWGNEHD